MIKNELFTEAITQVSPRVAFKMTSDTNEVITSVGNGLLIEAPWDFISDSFIGEFPSWKLKAKFMYIGDKTDYVGTRFKCEVGAYTKTQDGWGDINWITIGYFTVGQEGQVTDDVMKQIDLTMYNTPIELDNRYQPLELPMTGFGIRQVIANVVGLELSSEQLPLIFDTFTFNSLNVSTNQDISNREVLRQYAELNMASVYVDRNGKLLFKSVFGESVSDVEISNFDYDQLKHEKVNGPINSVIYTNKDVEDGQDYQEIESTDDSSVAANGKTFIKFSNNIFLDPLTLEQQQLQIDKLKTFVNGFSFTPFDLNYFAHPYLDPYDLIKLKDMQGNEFTVPITNMTFNYNGGLIGTLKTKELPESLTESDIPNIFDRVTNAEIRVDRANNKIIQTVESIEYVEEALNEQSTEISQTKNSIEQEIIDRTTQGELIVEQTSSLVQQTVDSFDVIFNKIEADQGLTNDEVELIQSYFRINENGVIIGKSDSAIEFFAENNRVGFRENGKDIAYWEEGTMHVDRLIAVTTIMVGYHLIEKYDSPVAGNTTIVRLGD